MEDKLELSEVDSMSIDDIDLANRALDAWRDAERRLNARLKAKVKK